MSVQGEDGTVRYSVKELFARIDGKLDSLASVLDAKADHSALLALAARVDVLEEKSHETEVVATALLKDTSSRWSKRQKVAALVFALLTVLMNMLALGPDLIHGWTG